METTHCKRKEAVVTRNGCPKRDSSVKGELDHLLTNGRRWTTILWREKRKGERGSSWDIKRKDGRREESRRSGERTAATHPIIRRIQLLEKGDAEMIKSHEVKGGGLPGKFQNEWDGGTRVAGQGIHRSGNKERSTCAERGKRVKKMGRRVHDGKHTPKNPPFSTIRWE